MTKEEALDLALEALDIVKIHFTQNRHVNEAITAIKQARALDKKAENARALGLDYEPVLKDNSNYRYDPPVAEPVRSCYCPNCEAMGKELAALKAQPAPVLEPVAWMYESVCGNDFACRHNPPDYAKNIRPLYTTPPAAQPAVPDAFGTREGEHPKYIEGWNDCRAEMMKGMK
jgi:hypothetical protein